MYKPVTYNGVEYRSIKELALSNGISYEMLQKRLKAGMDITNALHEPSRTNKKIIFKGRKYPSVTKLAEAENISPRLLMKMYAECGDIETAFEKSWTVMRKGITIWGKEYKDITAAALAFGLDPEVLRYRCRTGTQQIEETVEDLLKQGVTFSGKTYATLTELSGAYKVQPCTVLDRLRRGWTLSDAVTTPLSITSSGISVIYDGTPYMSRIDLCRSYNISYQWVCKHKVKFQSWLDTFEFAVRLKKETGFRDDEMFTSVSGCIIQGKRYHSASALFKEIGISSAKVTSYRMVKKTDGLFATLRAMQQEKTVRQINGKLEEMPQYPELQGRDFENGCIETRQIYQKLLQEMQAGNLEDIQNDDAGQTEEGQETGFGLTM